MTKQLSLVALAMLSLSFVAEAQEPRSKTFGRDWVRSHPFTITAVIQREHAVRDRMYVDAGMNSMMTWKDRPELYQWAADQQIPWHYHLNKREGGLSTESQSALTALLTANQGCEGVIVCDEPKLTDMPAAAENMAWVREKFPNLLVYSNAYPMVWTSESMAKLAGGEWLSSGIYDEPPVRYTYDEYLADFVRILKPDVLMMDQYPFIQQAEGSAEDFYQQRYFESLGAVRKAALTADIPFWLFIQAYAGAGGSRRLPSESDVRMQVYSSLAHGCTGISYFTYDAVEAGSMLDDSFKPTRIFADIAKLNREISAMGKVLRFLTSTDVRYVPGRQVAIRNGRVTEIPRGIGMFHSKSRVAVSVRDIVITDGPNDRNAMIGFFKDDHGGQYFMLVNLTHGADLSAKDGAISVKLSFAPSIGAITRLNALNGNVESMKIVDGNVDVHLLGGTGELFKLGDGPMPGLD